MVSAVTVTVSTWRQVMREGEQLPIRCPPSGNLVHSFTMRTFHTGGVASNTDITQGLPRVQEIFEARNPKEGSGHHRGQRQLLLSKKTRQLVPRKSLLRGNWQGEYVVPFTARMRVELETKSLAVQH